MNYCLEDWRTPHCKISYFDDLNKAEEHAVQLMDEIKEQLPSKAWGRGEWLSTRNTMEYTERGAIGSARVYVRIYQIEIPHKCRECLRAATRMMRAGYFCDAHYDEYWKQQE